MRITLILLATALLLLRPSFGNDSAASVGLGGVQLSREPRISMEKERLTIGVEKITVEFEFLNDTATDITTEVAFPVPPYHQGYSDAGGSKGVDDFKVWVDGRSVSYQVDSKAILNGVDHSGLLRRLGVDVASFGHFIDTDPKHDPYSPDIAKLSRSQGDELKRARLVEDGFPTWTVVKMYHWPQTFPAGKTLHVRHEYSPIAGFAPLAPEVTSPIPKAERTAEFARVIRDSCVDEPLQKALTLSTRNDRQSEGYIETIWIDYILTTANTWKTPIKNFELIVERPKPSGKWYADVRRWLVSFCWDGPIKQLDTDHFVARAANFLPQKELHVTFFGVN